MSAPHVPQHNSWVEQKHRAVRRESELRASTPLRSVSDAAARVDRALRVLDRGRIRLRHRGRTNA